MVDALFESLVKSLLALLDSLDAELSTEQAVLAGTHDPQAVLEIQIGNLVRTGKLGKLGQLLERALVGPIGKQMTEQRESKQGEAKEVRRGSEDGRNGRTLSTRELTDITESLRWKADQDLDAAKRLKGAGGVVEERWEGLERTLREQAKRKHELAEQLEQDDTALILRRSPGEPGEQE